MIINNINQPNENHAMLGNLDDVCILCAHEYAVKEKITLRQADKSLQGKFEGKMMFRIPLSGIRATICMDHIHKIAEANPVDEKAEVAKE